VFFSESKSINLAKNLLGHLKRHEWFLYNLLRYKTVKNYPLRKPTKRIIHLRVETNCAATSPIPNAFDKVEKEKRYNIYEIRTISEYKTSKGMSKTKMIKCLELKKVPYIQHNDIVFIGSLYIIGLWERLFPLLDRGSNYRVPSPFFLYGLR